MSEYDGHLYVRLCFAGLFLVKLSSHLAIKQNGTWQKLTLSFRNKAKSTLLDDVE